MPRFRFPDKSQSSNVITMLRYFANHKPVCGATVLLALKRNTNEADLTEVLEILQRNHIFVFTIASTDLLGPASSDNFYDMISKLNGIFTFNDDARQGLTFANVVDHIEGFEPTYSTKSIVIGKGSLVLPPFVWPKDSEGLSAIMVVTVQNHTLTTNFKSLTFTFESSIHKFQQNITNADLVKEGFGTIKNPFPFGLYGSQYTVKLDYDYDSVGVVEGRLFIRKFDDGVIGKFTSFASVRFDSTQGINFKFFNNQKDWADSIEQNLPKPEYRSPDNSTGSDVTTMLRMFLNRRPICGATILLALKRNSHDTELTDILQLLQMHHIMTYTVASDKMIGGSDSESMYNLVTRSNGIFIFNSDDRQGASIFNTFGHLLGYELSYSTTSVVNGQGLLALPLFTWPHDDSLAMMIITVQAHPLNKNFKEVVFTFENSFDHRKGQQDLTYDYIVNEGMGNACDAFALALFTFAYNVTLQYNYQNDSNEVVEARIFIKNVTSWPPYNN